MLLLLLTLCFVLNLNFSSGLLFTALRIRQGSRVKVSELWNLKNVTCGSNKTAAYRHNVIDNLDAACILAIYIFFNDSTHYIKYFNPKTVQIEHWLSSKMDFSWRGIPTSSDNIFINTSDDYEFLWLNSQNDIIYAGIHYNVSSTLSPVFVFSDGVPYTAYIEPTGLNGIQKAEFLEILFSIASICEVPHTDDHLERCPVVQQCPCPCAYKESLNNTNYTEKELYAILAPALKDLEDRLKVNKRNLSSYINRHVSASDSRTSSRTLGIGGVVFLCLVLTSIILMDLSSGGRHAKTVKNICKGTKTL